jgi:hypothetical protein
MFMFLFCLQFYSTTTILVCQDKKQEASGKILTIPEFTLAIRAGMCYNGWL